MKTEYPINSKCKFRLIFPIRIYFRKKENITESHDYLGKRYGDYTWLALHIGYIHINLFPKHIRRIWIDSDWRKASWFNIGRKKCANTNTL